MLTIRKAGLNDVEAISKLASESLETTFKGLMTTEQIDYLNDLSYSQGALKTALGEDGQDFFVASIDEENCGFASVIREGPDLFHLTKIYVAPQHQQKGVGRALLERIIEEIKKVHPQPCTLELAVNRHNEAAAFYSRMGMSKVREQLSDMGGGFMLAQDIMALKLG